MVSRVEHLTRREMHFILLVPACRLFKLFDPQLIYIIFVFEQYTECWKSFQSSRVTVFNFFRSKRKFLQFSFFLYTFHNFPNFLIKVIHFHRYSSAASCNTFSLSLGWIFFISWALLCGAFVKGLFLKKWAITFFLW